MFAHPRSLLVPQCPLHRYHWPVLQHWRRTRILISAKDIGQAQSKWLVNILTQIKKNQKKTKKGLMIVVHHPPFSAGGHSSSSVMLADIDAACAKVNCYLDVLLAAHSHNYQRQNR